MAWPQTAIVTDEPVTTVALNSLPVMIANTTLSGDAASIDFTSIPQHYAHLLLTGYVRGKEANPSDPCDIRFNGDTGSNYDIQFLQASAATFAVSESFGQTTLRFWGMPANTAAANLFAADSALIPYYAGTTNNKTLISNYRFKTGTATTNMTTGTAAGFWRSNSAITSISLFADGGNIASGSRVTLYGLP